MVSGGRSPRSGPVENYPGDDTLTIENTAGIVESQGHGQHFRRLRCRGNRSVQRRDLCDRSGQRRRSSCDLDLRDLRHQCGCGRDFARRGVPESTLRVRHLCGTARAEAAEALLAPKASPTFTGTHASPTASPGTNTTQLETTAFVETAIGGGGIVHSVFGRTGDVVAQTGDYTATEVGADPSGSSSNRSSQCRDLRHGCRGNCASRECRGRRLTQSGSASTAQSNAESFATSAVATETSRAEAAEALLAPLARPALTGTATSTIRPNTDTGSQSATMANVASAAFSPGTDFVAVVIDYSQVIGAPTLSGLPTSDGYTVQPNDRVLVVGISSVHLPDHAPANGIYIVGTGAGNPWSRPPDFASGSTFNARTVSVINGTYKGGQEWACLSQAAIVVDVNDQEWGILARDDFISETTVYMTDSLLPLDINNPLTDPTYAWTAAVAALPSYTWYKSNGQVLTYPRGTVIWPAGDFVVGWSILPGVSPSVRGQGGLLR